MQSTSLEVSAQNARRFCLAAIYYAKSGHPGGSLSSIDLLTFLFQENNFGIKNSTSHLILSKGHAAPALYAVALEYGLVNFEQLKRFRKINSQLQGHPHSITTPWVSTSTGSLGQGISVGMGMALGFKYQKQSDKVFVLMGDGEMQEGEVWEAAMAAAHHKLNNLRVIIDYNKMQSDDLNSNILSLDSLTEKWNAFNWHVFEINGHNFDEISESLKMADESSSPSVIIAHTVKGKGVKYMESVPKWHGSVTMSEEELRLALVDLNTPENLITFIFQQNAEIQK